MINFLNVLVARYDSVLILLPIAWRGPASLIVVLVLAGLIWHAIQKSGLWLILILVLVPALIPALRGVGQGLILLLKALLERANI